MIAPWAENFMGIPFREHGRDFSGVDCYGLVYLVYAHGFRVILNDWGCLYESSSGEKRELQAAIDTGANLDGWQRREHCEMRTGDVVVLRINGFYSHCGIIVDPVGHFMIHADHSAGVVMESLRTPKWASRIGYHVWHPKADPCEAHMPRFRARWKPGHNVPAKAATGP